METYTEAVKDIEVRRNWQTIAYGAEMNLRNTKVSLNDLNLRWTMLKNSGTAKGLVRSDFIHWQVLMRAAPENFIKRVRDLDDMELRSKFIEDALKWARGDESDESLVATFQEYAGSLRLRRVLREITFTDQFTAEVLDAFVHLTAPPQAVPTEEKAARVERKAQLVSEAEIKAEIEATRASSTILFESGLTAVKLRRFGNIDFVPVPAGKFVMGSKDDNPLAFHDEKPQHTVEIPYDYWIARYPVTNDQFVAFVEAAQYETTAEIKGGWSPGNRSWTKGFDWRHPLGPDSNVSDKNDHPVVQVSWHDAIEYCKWLNQKLRDELGNLALRLPTEAEWEKAARGEYGNEWPWGNNFDPAKCNSSEGSKGGTTPVGAYSPQGDSPYGAVDMAGNVWEWCHSLFKPYPYKADDGREKEAKAELYVVRGGSFLFNPETVRVASRYGNAAEYRLHDQGFRVIIAPQLS